MCLLLCSPGAGGGGGGGGDIGGNRREGGEGWGRGKDPTDCKFARLV